LRLFFGRSENKGRGGWLPNRPMYFVLIILSS
jgi:hypothetical protein